ncbi:hypothetical protein [Alkalicoccobacillus murimartini]|uniref:Uncharacterized protein n=1 Tax=Alkalicoccobacillus murimartini TaxID=171685 RepID=A0ABT9YIJ8_9BACI|nr:hypothetical protein [Alkalicoccobacillus murimartini]MDQ0207433.1 hypothetical protein [Alkalicoccobacillus murimartini]
MYTVIRTCNGETKTLKASNSHLDKSFFEFVDAEMLAKQLNNNARPGYHWTVRTNDTE